MPIDQFHVLKRVLEVTLTTHTYRIIRKIPYLFLLAEDAHWRRRLLQTFQEVHDLGLLLHVLHFLDHVEVGRTRTPYVHQHLLSCQPSTPPPAYARNQQPVPSACAKRKKIDPTTDPRDRAHR